MTLAVYEWLGRCQLGGERAPLTNTYFHLLIIAELGINLDSIKLKTKMVLNPMSGGNSAILADADMAGPILFVLLFAAALLAAGKVRNRSLVVQYFHEAVME